ncbi:hypothetical protein Poly24_36300 [Rosistilla carotiformis]|uniref:Uncharacterized protein n=1 Tax=Rosistilla carotiformis TaxID=2528017 RepID=A0A518JWJ3_9BACT|nr:hypothetical protein [Rosistilla carotiformis]QDV69912.1 hypothetical protein Poly24_36300 [Rosistilla carotiformis]
MHPFVETISIAGGIAAAIVSAIVLLTLFYRGMAWITGGAKPDTIAVRGVLKKDTLATVHVAGHKPFERVRFIGFTNSQTMKTHLPFELNGMVILEDEAKTRFLVRAKDIRMIVVPSDGEHLPSMESNL